MENLKDSLEKNYEALAVAIVEAACVDYVDAQIINIYGYLSVSEMRKKLYDAAIKYGKNRYMRASKCGRVRQDERRNMRSLNNLRDILSKDQARREAKADIEILERFFRSDRFNIYMPNTDGELLIAMLKNKAEKKERIKSLYATKNY